MRSLLELEAAADAEEAANAIPAFQEVDDHARELERQFVEVIRSAAHIAGELRAIREPWYKAARQASRAGHVVTTDPPRYTTRLLPSRLVDDVEREIAIWQAPSHERFMRERGPDGPVKLAEGLPAFGEHVQQTIRVERDGLGFLKPPAGMPLPQTNVTYIQDSAPSDQRGFRLPSFRKPKQDAPQASGGMETRGGDVA